MVTKKTPTRLISSRRLANEAGITLGKFITLYIITNFHIIANKKAHPNHRVRKTLKKTILSGEELYLLYTPSIYFKQIKTQQSALISEEWTINFDSDCWADYMLSLLLFESK